MDKRKLNWITWGFIAVTMIVVVMMLMNTLHRPEHIVLPDTSTASDQVAEDPDTVSNALTVVEITPKTVQSAIATLSRPEAYRRTVTVEQFWSTGSGSYETTVTVSGGWTRMDRTMPDGRVRHSIIGPEETCVWYNNEAEIYRSAVGAVSADNEQCIPTYEDILDLPVEAISTADYRVLSDIRCIYVEAAEEDSQLCYWVSVDTGLLVAAEKLLDGQRVYRMEALTVDQTEPAATEFTLPDGTNFF